LADCDLSGRALEERRTPGWAMTDTESNARNDRIKATEEDLISRILEGERDLFLELIRPYQRTVYATLITMLRSKEDAEDVTQDTFLKVLARLHQFRRESAFGT
jgi:RNA polymerase sigma-70 factor, ECF subfamily